MVRIEKDTRFMSEQIDEETHSSDTTVENLKLWKSERSAFLNDPDHGVEFFQAMNRKIAASLGIVGKDWPEITSRRRFVAALDFVTERVLSVVGFHEVMEKHADHVEKKAAKSETALSKWDYVLNRIGLVLSEWKSNQRDKPQKDIQPVATETDPFDPQSTPQRSIIPFELLSLRIDKLPEPQQAVFILFIGPLSAFPKSWKEKYLPVMCRVGKDNGMSEQEVEQRLESVIQQRALVPEATLLELDAKLCLQFENCKHFDFLKKAVWGQLKQLERSGKYQTESDVESELSCDCYLAVKKSSESDVLAMFASEEIYDQQKSGRRTVANHPLFLRRRFSQCCHKQKYHRRVWLNTKLELHGAKSVDGPMPHAAIAGILNIPVNTSYSHLFRARASLSEALDSDDLDLLVSGQRPDSVAEEIEQELQEERLQRYVCEDLRPPIR